MIRFLVAVVCIVAVLVGCHRLTRAERDAIKSGSGTAGMFLGLPRPVGEGIAGLILGAAGAFAGHKNGRRCERRHVARATSPPKKD